MSTRGKKSTEKTKQKSAAVKSSDVSNGKKKPEPVKQPEQPKPPKPPKPAVQKDSHAGA
jgi:hypothetical protein